MSGPSQGPSAAEPDPFADSSDLEYSPEISWTDDNQPPVESDIGTSPTLRRAQNRGKTPTPTRTAAAAAHSTSFTVATPEETIVWPTRAYRGTEVSYITPGDDEQEFAEIPPGWTVRLGAVYAPLDSVLPAGEDVVEFTVPGRRGNLYMDEEDNVFSAAPSGFRIWRDGAVVSSVAAPEGTVQNPTVTPVYPDPGEDVRFLVEGRRVPTTTFPSGGQLENLRVHRSEDENDDNQPAERPRTLVPFDVPNGPDNGTYYIDPEGELYDYVPYGWTIRSQASQRSSLPSLKSPAAAKAPRLSSVAEEEEEEEDSDEDEDDELPALKPLLTQYGVRFRDPARPGSPYLRGIPRDREVDVTDRAPADAHPPGRIIGAFRWRQTRYFIDQKHRTYTDWPFGCFIPRFEEEPAEPPRDRPVRRRTPPVKRRTPPAAHSTRASDSLPPPPPPPTLRPVHQIGNPSQPSPLKQVWNARYSSSSSLSSSSPAPKTPTNADNSTSSADSSSSGAPFNWLPPTADITWRQMGRMVRVARQRLNDLESRRAAVDNMRGDDDRTRPSGSLARAQRALKRSGSTQRRREEPEERRRPTDHHHNDHNRPPPSPPPPPPPSSGTFSASASSAPIVAKAPTGKTPTGSRPTQGSTGGKQSTASASGDKYPQPVEVTDPTLLASFRPISKMNASSSTEASAPNDSALKVPVTPRPARRPLPSGRPAAKMPGPKAVQLSRPVKASPLRQEIPLTSPGLRLADEQSSPPSPSPLQPTRSSNQSFPGFCVRSTQESRAGPPQHWVEREIPWRTHCKHLNDALQTLYRDGWFEDDQFTACIRVAMQRPFGSSSSSSSTRPRTFRFTYALSALHEQLGVELGSHFGELQAFRAAELRIIPACPSEMPEITEHTGRQGHPSLGTHWSMAMEYDGTLYYFDTVSREEDMLHRRNNCRRLFDWYRRIRAAAGITSRLRYRIVNVEPQEDGWECGLLTAELVRKIIQDHDGNVTAVTSWGPQSVSAIREKWVRAIIQDLGDAYEPPVPAPNRTGGSNRRRDRLFQIPVSPTRGLSTSSSASPSPSRGRGRPRGRGTQAQKLTARVRPQASRRASHVRRVDTHMRQATLFPTSSHEANFGESADGDSLRAVWASHVGSYDDDDDDAQMLSKRTWSEEVEADEGAQGPPVRKRIRRTVESCKKRSL